MSPAALANALAGLNILATAAVWFVVVFAAGVGFGAVLGFVL